MPTQSQDTAKIATSSGINPSPLFLYIESPLRLFVTKVELCNVVRHSPCMTKSFARRPNVLRP